MTFLTLSELNSFNDDQEPKLNEERLNVLGGIAALEKKLETNFHNGLCGSEDLFLERRRLFGKNEFPPVISATWLDMFLESFQDATLVVLIISAVVSLVIGVLEDPEHGWIEGTAMLVAVLLVAAVTATNNFNKESQFRKLNAVKDDVDVGVIRNGQSSVLNVRQLVVGDIVRLNAGDKVPADGVLISGTDVTCNESSLTGEPDDREKRQGTDPFLLSGTNVSAGYCHMLVIAVGVQSRWGKTKAKLVTETAETPLQQKLNVLAEQIGNFGMFAAVATFIALIAFWFIDPGSRPADITLFKYILKAFIMGVTIVVVAVPEGLPLAVTLSLAYSTQKMMHDNNLIRVLAACETMGNATNICSDKTGTLTQNRMTVVEAWTAGNFHNSDDLPTSKSVGPALSELISEGASVNSTAVLISSGDQRIVSGNNTEGALLLLLESNFNVDYSAIRSESFDASRGDRMFTFSSTHKCMSVLINKRKGKRSDIRSSPVARLYSKGAAEVILDRCSHYADGQGKSQFLTDSIRKSIADMIDQMAKRTLRTLILAHKEIPAATSIEERGALESGGLTLDILVGIKDPLRPDVVEAVRVCQSAGIFVRMVTGDNIETAKAIATECGILTPGGLAMEGPAFRKLTPAELDKILPTLQVLARSSPTDKHSLVTRLNGHKLPANKAQWEELHPGECWETSRDLILPGYLEEWQASRATHGGEVVGVTGDGTNDGPALKAADVGLSMGLSGTDVAKEASDIVIMDDNFSSIVKAVMWGRAVFDNIRKFLQFQLTVNVVALTLTFLSAVRGRAPPLNAVMMLWVNMIMDTMGALALGTEPPALTLLDRRPYKRNASLISNTMLRNILVQFVLQLALLAYLLFDGYTDFGVEEESRAHFTIIFNSFVFCQVFNEMNARSISSDFNIFRGLAQNPLFVGIIIFTSIAQYFLVEFGGDFVRTCSLTHDQWLKCVLLGALSLPVGGIMRLIPVTDRATDFAEISPIIAEAQRASAGKLSRVIEAAREKKAHSPSFYVWLLAVTVIPAIAYYQFYYRVNYYVAAVETFVKGFI